jgi:subtilisin family serine protease
MPRSTSASGTVCARLVLLAALVIGCQQRGGNPPGEATPTPSAIKAPEVVWLVMKQQADLTPARAMGDWKARGQMVYDKLTSTAAASQASVRARLAARGASFKPFWIVNAIRVEADRATIDELAKDPAVAKVLADRVYPLPVLTPGKDEPRIQTTEWGLNNIRAPMAWSMLGARGDGIVVANVDTGVQFDHPALVRQYRGNLGGGTFNHNYNWYDPSLSCGSPSLVPCDNNSHGTHTMGTMVGDDGESGRQPDRRGPARQVDRRQGL